MKRLCGMFVFLCFIAISPIKAEETQKQELPALDPFEAYKQVNLQDLTEITALLSGQEFLTGEGLNEYMQIHFCDLYNQYRNNDFEWQRIGQTLTNEISKRRHEQNVENRFYFTTTMFIERYDFQQKNFPFAKHSAISNVNALEIFTAQENVCGRYGAFRHMPMGFVGQLEQRLTVDKLVVDDETARLISARPLYGNGTRDVHARFYFRITGFDRLWGSNNLGRIGYYRIKIENITFALDAEMKDPIAKIDF